MASCTPRSNPAVCQPRKDSWRWQTSNSEYGKFYISIHREVHKDCSTKCAKLCDELLEAKAQLEKLKITCGRSICAPEGNQVVSCSKLPMSPKLGKCECPGRPGPPSKDMYITEHMNQFNGAERHDPQMLMDHIKDEHPHLVKRVRPRLPLSALRSGRNCQDADSEDDDAGCCPGKLGCGLGSSSGSESRSPKSGESRCRTNAQASSGKRKIVSQKALPPKKAKEVMYEAVSDLKHTVAGGANLPPTQRYNFYRYFGYAGQGARTSKGWHSVKSAWLPTLSA